MRFRAEMVGSGGYSSMTQQMIFVADATGEWRIDAVHAVIGDGLPCASRLASHETANAAVEPAWILRGTASNKRYTNRDESVALTARQAGLGRPAATRAALIPIRKTAAWWELTQDERRSVFEAQSRHIGIGMDYLPAVARRLLHSRDLDEPFDFLTWFEFAPADEPAFDALLARLRATPEWSFVEREVDVRLTRDG